MSGLLPRLNATIDSFITSIVGMSKLIAVVGATGQQGGAVANSLLERSSEFKVRALTRNPDSASAKKLAERGAEVVKADLNDLESMKKAFEGVHGVFIVTQFWDKSVGKKGEITQGKLAADAAKACGVKHLVYASVGGISEEKITGVDHFDTKLEVQNYIKTLDVPYTFVQPVAFYDNFNTDYAAPSKGVVKFLTVPSCKVQMIAASDIGELVAIVFTNPEKYHNKAWEIAGESVDGADMAKAFTNVMGYPFVYKMAAPRMILSLFSKESAAMANYMEIVGFKADIEEIRKVHPKLLTLEQWLRANEWEKKELKKPSSCSIM